MSQARTTELLEHQAPSGGAFAVTLGVENAFYKIHAVTGGTVNVTMLDGTVAQLELVVGNDYLIHGKQIDGVGGDTPTITAWG